MSYNLPNINIPDSEKDEDYHKKFIQSITQRSFHSSYDLDYASMDESVNFFNGTHGGDEFNFLQTAEDGDKLPAQCIDFNKIAHKVKLIIGELQSKGYDINVMSVNKDARVRKLEQREKARVNFRLEPDIKELEGQFGLGLLPRPEQEFTDEQDIDQYFKYNYKEKNEIIMRHALRYVAIKHDWDYERLALLRDVLIMGRCFVKCEMKNGLPFARRVDPRNMIFDSSATDDFLSDSTYFGEVRYMPIADAAAKYNLDKKEIEKVYHSSEQYLRSGNNSTGSPAAQFSLLGNSNVRFFRTEGDDLRVLVLSGVWQDVRHLTHKSSIDKYGNEHIKKVKGKSGNKGGDLITNRISVWRKATLIGGKIVRDYGEIDNSVRDNDQLAETECPYKGLIPNYLNGLGISITHQLKGLQKLKNITLYNVQLAMARAGGKGFIYDIAQVPDEWDIHTMMKYLKTAGIAFIDSAKNGQAAQFNQFKDIDLTLSKSVEQYLAINQMIDNEMDAITGINEARQGIVKNASQAVGVTRSALFQSNLATEALFNEFNNLNNRVFNYLAGLVKIAWAGKKKFAPIIGDAGINFLKENIDLALDDYGIYVEAIPPLLDDIQNFQTFVQAALQSGQIDFVDALKLMREKDITVAIDRFEKAVEKRRQEQQEQEQAISQQQAQAQQAQEQAKMQGELQKEGAKQEGDQTIQGMQDESELRNILAKGRVDLAGKQIDFTKLLNIEKIKAKNAKRVQANAKR